MDVLSFLIGVMFVPCVVGAIVIAKKLGIEGVLARLKKKREE